MIQEGSPAELCELADAARRERAALLARAQRHYDTVTEDLQIGPVRLILTRVADPDRVLQVNANREGARVNDPSLQPYWAEPWESGRRIAEQLSLQDLTGRAVLDLGCGLGLPGIIAAARGARSVLADAASTALLFARLNAWPWRDRVEVRRVDWRTDLLGEQFDLIIAADILYDPTDWPYLDQFWKTHLRADGRLLIGEPGRYSGDPFGPWLAERGWQITCTEVPRGGTRRPWRLLEASRQTRAA